MTSLLEIIARMHAAFASGASSFELDVLDPDRGRGLYAGERVEVDGVAYTHRPYRVWVDLAERLGLRLCTPRSVAANPAATSPAATSPLPTGAERVAASPLVRLRFEQLDPEARLRADAADPTERYGAASAFARVSKLEDPGFVLDLADALARVALAPGARILDIGVNTGDELALLLALQPALRDATLVGIDHSASAIAAARERFRGSRIELHVADVDDAAALAALDLGRFDLVISIGTLQSAGIDDRELLRRIVQDHLASTGAVILGMPNCRYIDGEVEYGARMKNYRQPELGLLVKDVAFYRKYLQQHHRHVFVTGKHYILVTGVANRPAV